MEVNKIYQGDALSVLKIMPNEFVDCVICSPPYWSLRDYGIEGQLGLEPTFQEYITKLCDIFDEVKRVLKKSGTCWVNMGDTYGNSGKGAMGYSDKSTLQGYSGEYTKGRKMAKESWSFERKPDIEDRDYSKCLLQIPSRFSIEMCNRRGFIIKNELDRAWLAGIIEGEGCIHIHKREKGRLNATYGAFLSIHNTNERMIKRITELTGLSGNIQTTQKERNHKLYRWNALSLQGQMVLREVYPYLVTKRDQARCALYCPSSGKDAEECWQNIKRMHNYLPPTREYPEPAIGGIDPWILRNTIIWAKPNCMPSSVKDRFTCDFEYVYFFVKNKKYWFERQFEAYGEAMLKDSRYGKEHKATNKKDFMQANMGNQSKNPAGIRERGFANPNPQGRNKRCVWTITTKPFKEAHFAVFPEELVETPIKAGCPKFVCNKCGKAKEKIYKNNTSYESYWGKAGKTASEVKNKGKYGKKNVPIQTDRKREKHDIRLGPTPHPQFQGYTSCSCNASFSGGIVLDPFCGSGTVGVVAKKLNRRFVGIELNPEYIKMAEKRIANTQGSLF